MNMLQCVILCGGLATRLRPITEKIPKSLITIGDEPFIAHQLRLLRSHGITDVVLCAGFLGEMIQEFAGNGSRFDLSISYSFDGPVLKGTAGAIRNALPLLSETFFVVYGDSYLPCDYQAVGKCFKPSGKRGLMTVFHNMGHFDSSNLEVAENRIVRYDKLNRTPEMQHIDYGLGAFQRSVFEEVQPDEFQDLSAVYQKLLAADDLASYEIKERFYEIGSLQGIQDLERLIADN